jgi:radical SAM protein with 4Fe4S-binding SPASM domain
MKTILSANGEIPKYLVVLVTRRCNLDCPHCYVDKTSKDELSYTQLLKGIQNFLDIGGGGIVFFGGEPLLRFDTIARIIKFIRGVAQKDAEILLYTNGILLNPTIAHLIKENNVSVVVGVNALLKEKYPPSLLGGKSELIKAINPVANIVVTPLILGRITNVFDDLYKIGFRKFKIAPDCTLLWSRKQLLDFKNNVVRFIQHTKKFKSAELVNYREYCHAFSLGKGFRCSQIFLGNDGIYSICGGSCYICPETAADYSIGTIESNIDLERRTALLSELRGRTTNLKNKCETCSISPYCFCPIQSFFYCKFKGKNFTKFLENICFFSNLFFGVFGRQKEKLKRIKIHAPHEVTAATGIKDTINSFMEDEICQLKLAITNECTNNCEYCFVDKGASSMSSPVMNNALDILIGSPGKNKKVLLFGGEPTLAFDKIDNLVRVAVAKAKIGRKNIKFGIATNAQTMTPEQLSFFSKHDFQISVSIDGKRGFHDRYRKRKDSSGTYNDVVKNLLLIQEKIVSQRISCLFGVHPLNVKKMYDNFMHIRDNLLIENINIEPIQNVKWDKKQVELFKYNLIKIFNKSLERISERNPFFINYINHTLKERIQGSSKRNPLYRNLAIFPNGEITDNPLSFYTNNRRIIGDALKKEVFFVANRSSLGILKIRNYFCGKFADYLLEKSKEDASFKVYISEAVGRVFE